MKNILIVLTLLVSTTNIFAQEQRLKPLLDTNPEVWKKEFFDLPVGFAQEMTVSGHEDASFPPGWIGEENENYWTYIFAWSVERDSMLTATEIEDNLVLYFDGLVGSRQDSIIGDKLPASALLITTSSSETAKNFTGKVKLFDRFTAKKMLTLNLLVEQQICPAKNRVLLVFRFSPKALEHKVWDFVKAVPLVKDACD